MTKHFCEICLKEIADSRSVDVMIYTGTYDRKEYCLSCFSDRKNWKIIHAVKKQKRNASLLSSK